MRKIGFAFLLLLVLAIVADITREGVINQGYIQREALGGEEKEVELQLNWAELGDDYTYVLEVPPVIPTKEEADLYFQKTLTRIEKDFAVIENKIPLQKEYLEGVVKAQWSFQPYGMISSEGEIFEEKLLEEETIIQAQVELTCGKYEQIYNFSFVLAAPTPSKEESILLQVEEWIQNEIEQEGKSQIKLPTEMDGVQLNWLEKKDYVTPEILLLEIFSLCLLWVLSKRKRVEEEKGRIAAMEREYPDIVSQLSLLLQAGMTTRQAWNRIAMQYQFKKESKMLTVKPVYEAILRMNRVFMEGESERVVYMQFLENVPASCYHKLMRMLLGNLEKGSQGLNLQLQEESRRAFELKIMQAKKLGEEASTKMLVPLMLMLVLVMGIIILPALMEFQI